MKRFALAVLAWAVITYCAFGQRQPKVYEYRTYDVQRNCLFGRGNSEAVQLLSQQLAQLQTMLLSRQNEPRTDPAVLALLERISQQNAQILSQRQQISPELVSAMQRILDKLDNLEGKAPTPDVQGKVNQQRLLDAVSNIAEAQQREAQAREKLQDQVNQLQATLQQLGPQRPLIPTGPQQPLEPKGPQQPLEPKGPQQPLTPGGPQQPLTPGGVQQPLTPRVKVEIGDPQTPIDPRGPQQGVIIGGPQQQTQNAQGFQPYTGTVNFPFRKRVQVQTNRYNR